MTIPYITLKQQEIPKLIYKFRFLNRLQIQTLLNHNYHKRIIDWLNDLVEKEYLEKVPKDNTLEQRSKPTIYRIGINGIRFLKHRIISLWNYYGNYTGKGIDQIILLINVFF